MSLHDKLIFVNLNDDDSIDLINVEPQPHINKNIIKWDNKKLSNEIASDDNATIKLCHLIQEKKLSINSASDVANLLEVPVGQFLYILYHKKNNYKSFSIKKNNGEDRQINAPQGGLVILQEKFKVVLDYFYRPKRAAHGFISGKSIKSNAEKHIKKTHVVNLDIEDYFSTITFARVYGLLKSKPFNFAHPAATVLAQLCTREGILPQGSCTSPVIANIISASLDKQFTQLAKRKSITYTRYADDITFSFRQKSIPEIFFKTDGENIEIGDAVRNIIESNGFKINEEKFRVQERHEKQVVTGLVVNDKVNVDRNYIRLTRAMIDKWCNDKVQASINFCSIKNIQATTNNKAVSIFRNHIYGRLSFIKMIRGGDFPVYLKLITRMSHGDVYKTKEGIRAMKETETFEIFICHASEDKESMAKPIYESLTALKIHTFIDHVEIKWGDSLIEKINSALSKAKFVIAILSANSVEKKWPLKELHAVLAREINDGKVKLLTLVKEEDEELIQSSLPLLQDKLFMVYKNNPDELAKKVQERLKYN
ncbi:TIR domain-containing anti-phage reverse transcriptase [Erwinia tasmaniensis]|uniref:TIR domain-containing anti-phage reverse transcriptase n=1 Tax=Erwinia tasmaniensis TaxID=338565 RepID=UPI003A4DE4E1